MSRVHFSRSARKVECCLRSMVGTLSSNRLFVLGHNAKLTHPVWNRLPVSRREMAHIGNMGSTSDWTSLHCVLSRTWHHVHLAFPRKFTRHLDRSLKNSSMELAVI